MTLSKAGLQNFREFVEVGGAEGKLLGQARPPNSTPVKIYSPARKVQAVIEGVTICNTETDPTTFSIYLDGFGETYDKSTAQYFNAYIDAESTVKLLERWYLRNAVGSLAVKTTDASRLTFSIYGTEQGTA